MIHISAEQIQATNHFDSLVNALREGFRTDIQTPMRHHHDYANPTATKDSTLLVMPAWKAGKDLGVKIITVSPDNGQLNLPAIQGLYLLFNAVNGIPKALLDGKALTVKRTAAASALASSYLSNSSATSLLMIGTGALAPNLIEAHCTQRPINKVYVWGRSLAKAEKVIAQLRHLQVTFEAIEDLDAYTGKADIISVATLSATPLIKGELLRAGQHIDLVGSYKKDTREADDVVIRRATLFVDTFQGGLTESGDIVIPIQNELITKEDVIADLYSLCRNEHVGRVHAEEITVFKSVGHASEDLIAAEYFYGKSQ